MTQASALFAAAAVLAAAATTGAAAQDETEAPLHYTNAEDGSAVHDDTGVTCPASAGDLVLWQVLSFDREDEHLGISCQYSSQIGSQGNISILRTDASALVGEGGEARRWNASLYATMAKFPGALPTTVEGLEGDPGVGLRGAVLTGMGQNGLPTQIGLWRTEAEGWTFQSDIAFLPTGGGWSAAAMLRQTVIDAKNSVSTN